MSAPEHLEKADRYEVFNNPLRWVDGSVIKPPADVDVAKYQKRLNQICGLSASGHPIIRLIWAWDHREWKNCEWDAFGVPTEGEWRQRYRFATFKSGETYSDMSVPRWILEERFEPGQYEASWEATRYSTDPETGIRRDVNGPAPREGWYKMIWDRDSLGLGIIATHDTERRCCAKMRKMGRKTCWGYYKTPGERELKWIARSVQERDAQPKRSDPNLPFPEHLVALLQEEEIERVEIEMEKKLFNLEDRMRNLQVSSMITGQQVFDVGLSYQRKESSGLYVPNSL